MDALTSEAAPSAEDGELGEMSSAVPGFLPPHTSAADVTTMIYRLRATFAAICAPPIAFGPRTNGRLARRSSLPSLLPPQHLLTCFCTPFNSRNTAGATTDSSDENGGEEEEKEEAAAAKQPIACGVYPRQAILNHSCEPNCVLRFAEAGRLLARVVRDVEVGEELCISYVDVTDPVGLRQQRLMEQYSFRCTCSKCERELRQLLRQARAADQCASAVALH